METILSFLLDSFFEILRVSPLFFIYWLIGHNHRKKLDNKILILEEQKFEFNKSIDEQKILADTLRKDLDVSLGKMMGFRDEILNAVNKVDAVKVDRIIKNLNSKEEINNVF